MKTVCTVVFFSWVFLFGHSLALQSQPDMRFFSIEPKDEAIAGIYIGLLDRDIEYALSTFNPDSGLVQVHILDSTQTHQSEYDKQSGAIRQTANLAGALGYAYSMHSSSYYQSSEVIKTLTIIFNTFRKKQSSDGGLTAAPGLMNLEDMAYHWEALMTAYALTQHQFSNADQNENLSMLKKGLDYLTLYPPVLNDHRSMVWCGVMAMGSRLTGEDIYLREAQKHLIPRVPLLFHKDGQVMESGNIDLQTSLLSLQYLFLYRLMSEDDSFDDELLHGMQWASRLFSFHGVPLTQHLQLTNAELRNATANTMGLLTYFGSQYEPFHQLATRYLETFITMKTGLTLQYGSGHFLRGAVYHTKPIQFDDIPYTPYFELYKTAYLEYLTIGKNYQTLLTLQSPYLYKGMQTWSYKGQPPVIAASKNHASHVLGFGIDSAKINRDNNRSSYLKTELTGNLETVIYKQNTLISGYVFAKDITVVVYHDEYENGWVDWVTGTPITMIQDNRVIFEETEARIFLPPVEPILLEKEGKQILRFPYKSGFTWFTFAGPESIAVIQPVIEGVVMMQLSDEGKKINLVINLSKESFQMKMDFPGTKIPIPNMEAFGSALIETNSE